MTPKAARLADLLCSQMGGRICMLYQQRSHHAARYVMRVHAEHAEVAAGSLKMAAVAAKVCQGAQGWVLAQIPQQPLALRACAHIRVSTVDAYWLQHVGYRD